MSKLLLFASCGLALSVSAGVITTNTPAEKLNFEMPADGRVAVVTTLSASGSGVVVLGTPDVGVDYEGFSIEPVACTNIVRGQTTGSSYKSHVRADPWRFTGQATVSNMKAIPVKVEWEKTGDIELGPDEKIMGNTYEYVSRFRGPTRNDSRCLKENHAPFNTYRWVIANNRSVTYCHEVKGRKFTVGKVDLGCSYVAHDGIARVEASKDGAHWEEIGTLNAASSFTFRLPPALLPADAIWIRLSSVQGEVQVDHYACTAKIDGEPLNAFGSATYREAKSKGAVLLKAEPSVLYNDDYGALVPGGDDALKLWTASSGWKVSRSRPLPKAEGRGVAVRTAANEAEAVQLIVKPTVDLADLQVTVSDLKGKGGALLKAKAVDLFRVGYVKVEELTDFTGTRDWWPDTLLPQVGACGVKANHNQPFWIRVKPPKGTPGGVYKGHLELVAKDTAGNEHKLLTPLAVQVFGFTLPDKMTLDTAFGISQDWLWKYHNATAFEDRKKIYPMYVKELTDHHLCPYFPFIDAGINITWSDMTHPLKAEPTFNWDAWDAAIERCIKEYNITTFQLGVNGLGWGNYEGHGDPEFHGYKGGTPEHEALMSKYLAGLDKHLVEKGWDKMAFVYWYDEPSPEDYPRVMTGFKMLRKYAPHLRLMLTEEPVKALFGGPNLWCPTSCNLHSADEAEARQKGEGFWWYICTQPKAPFATEFTDHAGSELRVWLWQTWMEKITGVLIWTTTWWSSEDAFPGKLQNPYTDAMCWSESELSPPGTRIPYGNGDGRFLYPPLSLANGPQGDKPNFEKPIVSTRLEILRDGIEDYEYFAMLKRLLAAKKNLPAETRASYAALLKVPPSVTTSLTVFTTDPKPMEDHRYRLALAIEQLSK